jgi:hypothetical protein
LKIRRLGVHLLLLHAVQDIKIQTFTIILDDFMHNYLLYTHFDDDTRGIYKGWRQLF